MKRLRHYAIVGSLLAAAASIGVVAQTRISQYPPATTISGPEIFLGNQNGQTVTFTADQIKTFTGSGGSGACSPNCVLTFNARTGAVTLQSSDISTALGAAPLLATNNLSDIAVAATARTNLGLGTAATVATGTSGATIPLLNASNTLSGVTTFSGSTASSRRTLATNTTLSATTDNAVCGDISGGPITLTMPPNTIPNGLAIMINDCKRQSATKTLTVAANSGQTISGAASIAITTNGGAVLAIWNSTDGDWNLF